MMSKNKSLLLVLLLLNILIIGCNKEKEASPQRPIADLYLPDMNVLFEEFNTIDSTKRYKEFASKIFHSNRDLNSSELYVYAANFYGQDQMPDSALIALNKAIDYGMSNPNILDKINLTEVVGDSELYAGIKQRLDSIAEALNKVDNFGLELGSMAAYWPYMQRAQADSANAAAIFKEFIFEGPQEVRDYYVIRYGSTAYMKEQMVNLAPKYYQYLQNQFSEDSINEMKTDIERWMKGFKELYPVAVFPKVYVVPGILNSGGTTSEMGMYIGGDMYGRSDQMPTEGLNDWQKKVIMVTADMSPLIMHELMHFEQNYKDPSMNQTVKGKVIGEGVCDFLAELLSGREVDNDNTRFLEDNNNWNLIVSDFKATRDTGDLSKWMYNGGNIKDRPGDMGYTLGYLVSKSYYQNHDDKKQAVYNLLNTENVDEIYRGSNYAYLLD